MIPRALNAFFLGLAFVSIIDFLLFISFKINYFDAYNIKEYFNVIFIDNQNFSFLLPLSFVVGYLLFYTPFSKIFLRIYILVVLLSLLSLYEPIGKEISKQFFFKEDMYFQVGQTTFMADLLYKGRNFTYLFRKDLQKVVKLKNSELKSL
jgi:hypothetical protein